MTEKMKSVCVGRFLVDVPANAAVMLSREMMDGYTIVTVEETEMAFRERITARGAAIQSPGSAVDGTGGMVEASDLHVPGMIGRKFVFGRNRGYLMEGDRRIDDEDVSVEVHGHTGGMSFSLSMKNADVADADLAEGLLARLRRRGEDEVPTGPGFCIWRGFFVEPLPAHATEHIVMHIGLPRHPDVGIAFASLPGGGTTRSLLTRVKDMDAEAGADEMLRVTKLRTGKRHINDLSGEEVLERVRELNFATTFGFVWETEGVKDDPLKPFLSLELHSGISLEPAARPADSSLHEDAVLALWDMISSSIRMRPTSLPLPAGHSPLPEPKLGAIANPGNAFP